MLPSTRGRMTAPPCRDTGEPDEATSLTSGSGRGSWKSATAQVVTRWLPTSSVRELPRMFAELKAPPGVTDVIFVTDAVCRLPPEVRTPFLAWKRQAKARLVTLVLNTAAGDLASVSDELHFVATLDPDADAVGRVLSL